MELKILGNSYNFANEQALIEEIFDFINDKLNDSEYFFSHLLIDNVEVYDDFDIYIDDVATSIEVIEVIAKTSVEFTHDILLSLEQYLKGALPELNGLVLKIYQTSFNDALASFSQFLDGVQWINDAISTIDSQKEKPSHWDDVIITTTNLHQELKGLEEAIENTDTVLIADIMQYEIVPLLNTLQQAISTTIDSEVKRNDFN